MLEAIINLALMGMLVALIVIVLVSAWKNDFREPPCDYDCDHCPFPKCDDKRIEGWKTNDIHNR